MHFEFRIKMMNESVVDLDPVALQQYVQCPHTRVHVRASFPQSTLGCWDLCILLGDISLWKQSWT